MRWYRIGELRLELVHRGQVMAHLSFRHGDRWSVSIFGGLPIELRAVGERMARVTIQRYIRSRFQLDLIKRGT